MHELGGFFSKSVKPGIISKSQEQEKIHSGPNQAGPTGGKIEEGRWAAHLAGLGPDRWRRELAS